MAETIPTRAETGVMQFGNDWPGYFIRGDNAFAASLALYTLLDHFDQNPLDAGMVDASRRLAYLQVKAFAYDLAIVDTQKNREVQLMQPWPQAFQAREVK